MTKKTNVSRVTDYYSSDLAYIHDVGFSDHVRNMSQELLSFLGAGNPQRLILDLGCGAGVSTRAFAQAGFRAIGVDISAAMIALARSRDSTSKYVCSSFLDYKIPSCDSAVCCGEVINYLFDRNNSKTTLRRFFSQVFQGLKPGGLFALDFAEPGRHSGPGQAFREGDDWACLVSYQHDPKRQRLSRDIVSFRKVGEFYRRAEESHTQQLYPAQEIAGMLRKLGFTARVLRRVGAYELPPQVAAVIARKPACPRIIGETRR